MQVRKCPVCKEVNQSKGVTCGKECGIKLQRRKCAAWWRKNKEAFRQKLKNKKRNIWQ
jgi:hypothetical protein